MGTKIFGTYREYELVGDARDIAVDWHLRKEVFDWCIENRIHLEYQGSTHSSSYASKFGIDLWRVRDEQQRVAFILKWGNANSS